jgi:hypothetical protein
MKRSQITNVAGETALLGFYSQQLTTCTSSYDIWYLTQKYAMVD